MSEGIVLLARIGAKEVLMDNSNYRGRRIILTAETEAVEERCGPIQERKEAC
jgi:hypothetical protein